MNAPCGFERMADCGESESRRHQGRPAVGGGAGSETRAQQGEDQQQAAVGVPSGRDVELFRAVKFELVSTRAAAERFGISQTRVRQIVARVARWYGQSIHKQTEAQQLEELRLTQHVAAERLQAMLENLTILWRINYEPKFQRQMQRVIAAQARLGVAEGQFDELVADTVGELPHDGPIESWPVESPPANPPVGDCSPAVDAHTLETLRAFSPMAATRYEDMVSGYAQVLAELAELRQMAPAADLLSQNGAECWHPPLAGGVALMSGETVAAQGPAMST